MAENRLPWEMEWTDEREQAVQQPGGMFQAQSFVPEADIQPWDQSWGAPELRPTIPEVPEQIQPAPTEPPIFQDAPPRPDKPWTNTLKAPPPPSDRPQNIKFNRNGPGELIGDFLFRPIETGIGEAAKDFQQSAKFAWGKPFERGPTPVMAQPPTWSKLQMDPRNEIPKIITQGVRFFPAVVAAVAGSMATGGTGPVAALGGAAAGGGFATIAQSLGLNAEEAFARFPDDPEAAYQQLIATTAIDTASTIFGTVASGFNPFSNMLRNILAQTFLVQPGIGIAGMRAHNEAADLPDMPLEDELLNVLGPSFVMAGGGQVIESSMRARPMDPWQMPWEERGDGAWEYDPEVQNVIPEEDAGEAAAAQPRRPSGPPPGGARANDGAYLQRRGIGDNGGPKEDFFYKSERVVKDLNQPRASAEQWDATLRQKGVKAEEMDDLGLTALFGRDPKAVFTREQLIGIIDGNKVQMRDIEFSNEGLSKLNEEQVNNHKVVLNGVGRDLGIPADMFSMYANDAIGGDPVALKWLYNKGVPRGYLDAIRSDLRQNSRELNEAVAAIEEDSRQMMMSEDDIANKITHQIDLGLRGYPAAFDTLYDRLVPEPLVDELKRQARTAGIRWPQADWMSPGSETNHEFLLSLDQMDDRNFEHGHWTNERNVLAHKRFGVKVMLDGTKAVDIYEGQSDWHNAGRKKGYTPTSPEVIEEARLASEVALNEYAQVEQNHRKLLQEAADLKRKYQTDTPQEWVAYNREDESKEIGRWPGDMPSKEAFDGAVVANGGDQNTVSIRRAPQKASDGLKAEMYAAIQRASDNELVRQEAKKKADAALLRHTEMARSESVDDAPFKKSYGKLLAKKLLKWAIDRGIKRITWNPGEVVAERFGLDKALSKLDYVKTSDGKWRIEAAAKDPRGDGLSDTIADDKLDQFVGRDLAKKIRAEEGEQVRSPANGGRGYGQWRRLSGDNLKIKSDGKRQFYDVILPNAFKEISKKHGGKIGQIDVPQDRVGEGISHVSFDRGEPTAEQVKGWMKAPEFKKLPRSSQDALDDFVMRLEDGEDASDAAFQMPKDAAEFIGGEWIEERDANTAKQPYFDIPDSLAEEIKNEGQSYYQRKAQPEDGAMDFGAGQAKATKVSLTREERIANGRFLKDLERSIKQTAPHVKVAFYKKMTIDEPGRGKSDVPGMYMPDSKVGPLIILAMEVAGRPNGDINMSRWHENWHALQETGLIRPHEERALYDFAMKEDWIQKYDIATLYRDNDQATWMKEAVAEGVGELLSARDADLARYPRPIRRIIANLKRSLRAISRAVERFKGRDVTAEAVIDAIYSGEAGRRAPNDSYAGNDVTMAQRKQPVDQETFAAMAAKGKVRQARTVREDIRDIKRGKMNAVDLDFVGTGDGRLGHQYEMGEITDGLKKAGLHVEDDRMGTVFAGKTKADVDALRNAQTPDEFGRAYGYSEDDIAAFYVRRRGGDVQAGYGEYVRDLASSAPKGSLQRKKIYRPEDRATFNGKPFWSGAFDPLDGHIMEVHDYAKAESAGWHHSHYFSDRAQQAMREGNAQFFWVDDRGDIKTEWREGEAPKQIVDAIRTQIKPRAPEPITVYHGGNISGDIRTPLFVSPDMPVAETYAKDREGRLSKMTITPEKLATGADLDRVARMLKIDPRDFNSSFEMVDPAQRKEAPAIIKALREEGFDAVLIEDDASMDDPFTEVQSYAVLNPAIIKRDPTMLRRAAPESPEFKAWFKGSRVTDKDGKPIVVYHGTKWAWDEARKGDGGIVAWFTEDSDQAHSFIGGGRRAGGKPVEGSAIMPAYLSIKRPVNLGRFPKGVHATLSARELFARAGVKPDEMIHVAQAVEDHAAPLRARYPASSDMPAMFGRQAWGRGSSDATSFLNDQQRVWELLDNVSIIKVLKDRGYDGVRAKEFSTVNDNWIAGKRRNAKKDRLVEATTWAAFEPEQIKSSSGNRGAYDPNSKNILLQRAHRETPEFKAFTKGLPIVEDGADGYEGGGAVFEAFHGTTHNDITEFKEQGYSAGFLGKGPYLTTTAEDASRNYAGVGPDLTTRIEGAMDELYSAFDDDDSAARDMITDMFEKEGWGTGGPEFKGNGADFDDLKAAHRDDAVRTAAEAQVKGPTDGLMMKLYVRLEKPADITDKGPDLTREIEYDEEGDLVSDSGPMREWLDAAYEVGSDFGVDTTDYRIAIEEHGDSISMSALFDLAEKHLDGVIDNGGEYITPGGVFREIAKQAGYDGVIMDANKHFGARMGPYGQRRVGMAGVDPSTLHIVPFKSNAVKSATGNSGAYSDSPNIMLQRARTDTPEFKKWFGKSQAVDRDGKPMVVYHGTDAEMFSVFDTSDAGAWFAENRRLAEEHMNKKSANEHRRVYEAFIRAEKPFRIPKDIDMSDSFDLEEALDRVNEENGTNLTRKDVGYQDSADHHTYAFDYFGISDDFFKAIRKLGFDSVHAYEEGESTWNVLKPNQVKSATGNSGKFSRKSGDIYLQRKHLDTPEFKRFFGKSHVTEDLQPGGTPLRVYRGEHGLDQGQDIQTRLPSITFVRDPEIASGYALAPNDYRETPQNPRTIPAYLRIENPIIKSSSDPFVDFKDLIPKLGEPFVLKMALKHGDRVESTGAWIEEFSQEFMMVEEMLEADPRNLDKLYMDVYPLLDDPEFVAAAKAAGYDGAIHIGNGESATELEYRVFDQSQIKSASGNNGQYSDDPSIMLQRKGGGKKPPNEVIIEHAPIPKNDQGLPDTRDIMNWPAQKANMIVGAVGKYLEGQTLKANNGKPLDPWDPADHHRITQTAIAEARDQFMQLDHGANWYASEITEAFRLSAIISPRLAKDETARSIMSIMAAITSNGNRAGQNWRYASQLFEHYEKTGNVIDKNPVSGNIFGQKGHTIAIGLRGLDKMIKEMGEVATAEWILTNHTIKEIREMQVRMGWKAGTVTGKQFDTRMGAFMFGPKIGPFLLNIHGVREATIDSWMVRQFGRYVGELTSGANLDAQGLRAMPSTPKERALMVDLVTKVGDALGIAPQDAQALLWYYEQRLYRSLGAKSARSESFTDGARKELELRGLKDITPPKPGAAKPGVQGRLGSSDAPQIEGPKGPASRKPLLQRKGPDAGGDGAPQAVKPGALPPLSDSVKSSLSTFNQTLAGTVQRQIASTYSRRLADGGTASWDDMRHYWTMFASKADSDEAKRIVDVLAQDQGWRAAFDTLKTARAPQQVEPAAPIAQSAQVVQFPGKRPPAQADAASIRRPEDRVFQRPISVEEINGDEMPTGFLPGADKYNTKRAQTKLMQMNPRDDNRYIEGETTRVEPAQTRATVEALIERLAKWRDTYSEMAERAKERGDKETMKHWRTLARDVEHQRNRWLRVTEFKSDKPPPPKQPSPLATYLKDALPLG